MNLLHPFLVSFYEPKDVVKMENISVDHNFLLKRNSEKLNETNNTLPKQLCGSAMIFISFLPDVAFDDLYFDFSTFLTYIQESN